MIKNFLLLSMTIFYYIYINSYITFDLEEVKIINTQFGLIHDTSCVLGLKDGNALVGTKQGYIYLISYKYSKINILDSRLLCPNQEIFSLSLNSNCTPDTITCYIITANCGGFIYIFEIRNPDTDL